MHYASARCSDCLSAVHLRFSSVTAQPRSRAAAAALKGCLHPHISSATALDAAPCGFSRFHRLRHSCPPPRDSTPLHHAARRSRLASPRTRDLRRRAAQGALRPRQGQGRQARGRLARPLEPDSRRLRPPSARQPAALDCHYRLGADFANDRATDCLWTSLPLSRQRPSHRLGRSCPCRLPVCLRCPRPPAAGPRCPPRVGRSPHGRRRQPRSI